MRLDLTRLPGNALVVRPIVIDFGFKATTFTFSKMPIFFTFNFDIVFCSDL